jgi:hypothetical protein
MVDLDDESDAAIERRIESELAEGRKPKAIIRSLIEQGAERERAERLVSDVLREQRVEAERRREPESPAAPPRHRWLLWAGGFCLALGVVSTLLTGKLAYGSLVAGVAAIVAGLRAGGRPSAKLGDRAALLLLLGFGAVAAVIVILLVRRSDPSPAPVSLSELPELPASLPAPAGPTLAHEACDGLAFSPRGLLATRGGNTVRVWDTSARSQLYAFDVEFEPEQLAFVAEGRALVALASSGDVERFELADGGTAGGERPSPWRDEANGVVPAIFPDGEKLVTGGDTPALWSFRDAKRLGRYKGAPGHCQVMVASSRHVVGACQRGIAVWSADKPRALATLGTGLADELAISPGGSYLVASSWRSDPDAAEKRTYRYDVYDLDTFEPLHSIDGEGTADDAGRAPFKLDVAFDAGEAILVVRTGLEEVSSFDPRTGRRSWKREVPSWGFDLDLSPGGETLALSASEVELVDLGRAE